MQQSVTEVDDGSLVRYRCDVGYALTGEAMMTAQARKAEELLWSLLRSHQQHAELTRRMAHEETALHRLASLLLGRAELVRRLLARAEGGGPAGEEEVG